MEIKIFTEWRKDHKGLCGGRSFLLPLCYGEGNPGGSFWQYKNMITGEEGFLL